jgi:hybrid polyketide synthase/nonribosomal peptide synthetase ACE1
MDQMFSALSTGSTLYVVPKAKRGDPTEISKIILDEGITYTKATPSEYSSWVRYGGDDLTKATSWKKAFAGGESLTDNQRQAFRSLNLPELKLMNCKSPSTIIAVLHSNNPQHTDLGKFLSHPTRSL